MPTEKEIERKIDDSGAPSTKEIQEKVERKIENGLDHIPPDVAHDVDKRIDAGMDNIPPEFRGPNVGASFSQVRGTNVWGKFFGGGDPLEYVPAKSKDAPQDLKKRVGEHVPQMAIVEAVDTDKKLFNSCMQMNCNSQTGALAAGGAGNSENTALMKCIQGSKTPAAVTECLKLHKTPQGDALKTCLVCKHCVPGNEDPKTCLALSRDPNDIRSGP